MEISHKYFLWKQRSNVHCLSVIYNTTKLVEILEQGLVRSGQSWRSEVNFSGTLPVIVTDQVKCVMTCSSFVWYCQFFDAWFHHRIFQKLNFWTQPHSSFNTRIPLSKQTNFISYLCISRYISTTLYLSERLCHKFSNLWPLPDCVSMFFSF